MPFLSDVKPLLRLTAGCLLAGILTAKSVHGQDIPAAPPLFLFFQQHFDSTLVYQTSSVWHDGPDLLILAKQGREMYFFTYRSPYGGTASRYVPGKLDQQFRLRETQFYRTPPDTNQYLLPQPVPPLTLDQAWKSLHPTKIWRIRNSATHPPNVVCGVDDADTITLHLLTHTSARTISFYAPEYYEKCEGPDPNRQQVIRTGVVLHALLNH